MERQRISRAGTLPIWVFVAAVLSQHLLVPVMCIRFQDDKHYYSPDPGTGSPPSGSHGTPSHGTTPSPSHGTPSHGGGYTPTPSHGGGYTPTPTPSHGGGYTPTPNPSHGGGYTPNPPSNCGNPPHDPTPSTPSGGYYRSPPPSGGGTTPTPVIVAPPSGGGTTPTPVIVAPPTPPTPDIGSPPTTPVIDPGTPGTPFFPAPTPPFTGTCDYWRTHPTLIWGLLGWWGNVGNAFGPASVPGFGSNMSLLQALSNTRTDGIGALYREGTASWLNSMVNNKFPFTTTQVRENFLAALSTTKAAATQAHTFKLANEGRLKPRS